MEKIRRCEFRNCCKIVEGRSNKKFCSERCKVYENIYLMRERNKYKAEKNHIFTILETFKNGINEETLELYKKLYKK